MSGRQRAAATAVGTSAVAVAALLFADVGGAGTDRVAVPTFTQQVPADVRRETGATWAAFTARFAARADCWDDVSIELVRVVDGGDARYVAADARIEIRIPTTPARYRESLVHELAHHVERTCADFVSLRSALGPLLAGGTDTWFSGATWEAVPSERYAEAVVELVNEQRIRHEDDVPVDDEVIALVERWGAGRDLDDP